MRIVIFFVEEWNTIGPSRNELKHQKSQSFKLSMPRVWWKCPLLRGNGEDPNALERLLMWLLESIYVDLLIECMVVFTLGNSCNTLHYLVGETKHLIRPTQLASTVNFVCIRLIDHNVEQHLKVKSLKIIVIFSAPGVHYVIHTRCYITWFWIIFFAAFFFFCHKKWYKICFCYHN